MNEKAMEEILHYVSYHIHEIRSPFSVINSCALWLSKDLHDADIPLQRLPQASDATFQAVKEQEDFLEKIFPAVATEMDDEKSKEILRFIQESMRRIKSQLTTLMECVNSVGEDRNKIPLQELLSASGNFLVEINDLSDFARREFALIRGEE